MQILTYHSLQKTNNIGLIFSQFLLNNHRKLIKCIVSDGKTLYKSE